MMEYHRITDGVFRLSSEERHRLFERMAKEYLCMEGYFQCCDVCSVKQVAWTGCDVDIEFLECVKWKECRHWRCEECMSKTGNRASPYFYVCDYHDNITLRSMAFMHLKYTIIL